MRRFPFPAPQYLINKTGKKQNKALLQKTKSEEGPAA